MSDDPPTHPRAVAKEGETMTDINWTAVRATCSHDGSRYFQRQWTDASGMVRPYEVSICTLCGHWCSLGESEDGGEHAAAIAVEVRAEELAAAWKPIGGVRGVLTKEEREGWCDMIGDYGDAYQRGWLAYHILSGHDDEQQTPFDEAPGEDDQP